VKRAPLLAVLALISLVVTGCGSSSKGGSDTGTQTGNAIRIQDFSYSPSPLTVSPGQTVTVSNKDSATHTVTSVGAVKFLTGSVSGGGTATFTAPSAPGTYHYICDFHSSMKGTLVVK
jgi:plastocyanin